MKLFDTIRRYFARNLIRQQLRKPRQVKAVNYGGARSVAIIYREQGEPFFILIKQFVRYLREEQGINKVMALAYVDHKKQLPHYHKHKLRYDYFTRAGINWKFQPTDPTALKFIGRDYDLLIDFERGNCLPLQYILAASNAKFKVGIYQAAKEDFYDLMLNIRKEDTFDTFINQLNHYLNTLNTGHARA